MHKTALPFTTLTTNTGKVYRGKGDYLDVTTNELIVGGGGDQMRISVNPDNHTGDLYFSHTEYIGQIVADIPAASDMSPFQVHSYPLNAALEGTFPFLAQIAANFAMYEFQGLVFQYKPNSGEGGGASKALGKVCMATDYDPEAMPFTNMQAMENYSYANSTKPSRGLHHGVECKKSQRATTMLYTRTDAMPIGPTALGRKNKVFTDLGLFQIATQGVAGNQDQPAAHQVAVGELWVSYKIKLSRTQLSVAQGLSLANFDDFIFSIPAAANAQPAVTSIGNSNSLGGALVGLYQDPGTTSTSRQGLRYTFPANVVAGTYLLTYNIPGNRPPLYLRGGVGWQDNADGSHGGPIQRLGLHGGVLLHPYLQTGSAVPTELTYGPDDPIDASVLWTTADQKLSMLGIESGGAAGGCCAQLIFSVLAPDGLAPWFDVFWADTTSGTGLNFRFSITQVSDSYQDASFTALAQ